MRRSTPKKAAQSSHSDIEQGSTTSPLDPPSVSPQSYTFKPRTRSSHTNNTTNRSSSSPSSSLTTPATIIHLLKDTILGVTLGTLTLLTLFYLDYRTHLLSLHTTTPFQQTTIQLLNDPEVIKAMEDSMDIKLLSLDTYNGMIEETRQNIDLIENSSEESGMMKKYQQDLQEKLTELDQIKVEHTKLLKELNQKYQLDKWCGGCKEAWGNCDMRVGYLKDKYGNGVLGSKIDIMREGKCVNK